jgi:hypothetical protein
MSDIPLVPCPYGDRQPVDLAYYLAHQADFCLHQGKPDDAKMFQAAADWVRIMNADKEARWP